jgi:uncharacterized protein YbjT (DUF2867 family)
MIAVTGATGEVGGRVARRLAGAGVAQRLVVRDAARAPALPEASVAVAPGGYADRAGMTEAFRGASTVFLVPAAEAVDRIEQHKTAVDAAVAAGASQLVYLSFVAAAPDSTFSLGRHHWATEEHIRASGVPWTFLRMSMYMDFIPNFAGPDDVIRGPAGDGRVAAVLRDDVAGAAVAVLADPGAHAGSVYALTGPAAFSLGEAADALSRAWGRAIRYVEETEEEAYASRSVYGAPAWEVEGWVTSYVAIRDGSLARVATGVRELTGRDPVSLDDWLARPGATP